MLGTADLLRTSVAFCCIHYATGLHLRLKDFVSRYFWGGAGMFDPAFILSTVDVCTIREHAANRFSMQHALSRVQGRFENHRSRP